MHGYLLGLGLEHEARHADDIADIIFSEIGKFLLGHIILADIQLKLATVVFYVAEYCLSHATLGHYAACDLNGLAVERIVIGLDIGRICASNKFGLLEGVSALLLESSKLITANLQDLGKLLCRYLIGLNIAHMFPSNQVFSTERISKCISPAGASTLILSPATWPYRPLPKGESSDTLPSMGFASCEPTMVYVSS